MEISKKIISDIRNGVTSIGDNPAIPPEDEDKFLVHAVKQYAEKTLEEDASQKSVKDLVNHCMDIERDNEENIEQLCTSILADEFNIPDDTLTLSLKKVETVDESGSRIFPEETSDFEFNSIDDMNRLSDEIYKRRLLNALSMGAALFKTISGIRSHSEDIDKMGEHLSEDYISILKQNETLRLTDEHTHIKPSDSSDGKVDVYIAAQPSKCTVIAEGTLLTSLLFEACKGIYELAISYGLPEDVNEADYVMKKADFKFCENYDMILGPALWLRIYSLISDGVRKYDNYILMEFAKMQSSEFNNIIREVFAHTKRGKELLENIEKKVKDSLEEDEFYNTIDTNNGNMALNDEEEYLTLDGLKIDFDSIDNEFSK